MLGGSGKAPLRLKYCPVWSNGGRRFLNYPLNVKSEWPQGLSPMARLSDGLTDGLGMTQTHFISVCGPWTLFTSRVTSPTRLMGSMSRRGRDE